jgi:tetratricopeptide (TPR) repeat protein
MTAWRVAVVLVGLASCASAQAQDLETLNEEQVRKRIAVHLDNKRIEEALEAADHWVEVAPRDPEAWAMRARLRQDMGQLEAAVEDLSRVLAMDPGRARAYADRGALSLRLGRQADALPDATRALELDPELAFAHFVRGLVQLELGHPEQSIADLERAIALSPPNPRALHARGRARKALGQTEAADADVAAALELDPRAGSPWGVLKKRRDDGHADLSHVRVGQRYRYAMQNKMTSVWTVLEVGEDLVRYELTMLMDMGQGPQPVGDPQEQTWQFIPPQGEAAGGMPANVKTSRGTVTVSGIEFDCLIVESKAGGVLSESWVSMTPGSDDVTTFPGVIKAFMDGTPAMVLVEVVPPKK